MANRRMFSLDIIDTDKFTDMPSGSQALYFHLGMRADDDGFVSSPRKIMRSLNFCDDEMKILISKGFVHVFETGICVIMHWKMNNYIQKDRYKATIHHKEHSAISVGVTGEYLIENHHVNKMDTACIQDVSTVYPQVRLGKVRLGKVREENTYADSEESASAKDADSYCDDFEKMWEVYERRGVKRKAYNAYKKLSKSEIAEVWARIREYVKSTPETKYRKYLEGYLNKKDRYWENEIVNAGKPAKSANHSIVDDEYNLF